MIVTVGSVRGSPGATSWALLLGAAWPAVRNEQRVVLEADPAGGVVGARYSLGVEPGVVNLVTAARRDGAVAIEIEGIGRAVSHGLSVVPGPESGDHARMVWRDGASEFVARLQTDTRVWIVDIGRNDRDSPSYPFVDASVVTVVVAGPRPEDLVQLPSRIATLRRTCPLVGVLVSGRCGFTPEAITDFADSDAAWVVDPRGDLLDEVGRVLANGRVRRSWLWRQALSVAEGVAQLAVGTRVLRNPDLGVAT